jgi:hypothetical protein
LLFIAVQAVHRRVQQIGAIRAKLLMDWVNLANFFVNFGDLIGAQVGAVDLSLCKSLRPLAGQAFQRIVQL